MSSNCARTCCEKSRPAPTPGPPTASAASTKASWCSSLQDKSPAGDCAGWKAGGYCRNVAYEGFMLENCAATCDKTDNSQHAADCPAWASGNYCTDVTAGYIPFMQLNCRGSCCATTAYSSFSDSSAYQASCGGWAAAGFCTNVNHSVFMFENCVKSCGEDICASDVALHSGSCPAWANTGYCSNLAYSAFMSTNCAGSCRQNNPIHASSCSGWKSYCTVPSYGSFMANDCPVTCCQ